jgi:hypothetical protein
MATVLTVHAYSRVSQQTGGYLKTGSFGTGKHFISCPEHRIDLAGHAVPTSAEWGEGFTLPVLFGTNS